MKLRCGENQAQVWGGETENLSLQKIEGRYNLKKNIIFF